MNLTMTIQQKIKVKLVEAMKARDEVRVLVLRGIGAACTNKLVQLKKSTTEPLGDEDAAAVLKKQAKQRRDSIEQFEKGGRSDLAQKEKAELAIVEEITKELTSS
jgi:uncharacterized protein YqeY